MNDYCNLLTEYQELQSNFKNQIDDVDLMIKYIGSFTSNISSFIKYGCKYNILKDDLFNFFTALYKNFLEDINKLNLLDIVVPLQQLKESQNINKKRIFNLYNDIKNNLFEGKQKLINAKNNYLEFIKGKNKDLDKNNKTENNKSFDDNSLLNEAKKQNFFILYKYELAQMNEKIEKNNLKYKEILNELDSINMNKINTYNTTLLEFAKTIGIMGNKCIEFEKKLKEKITTNNNNNINNIKNDEIKIRFPKEVIESNEILHVSELKKDNNNKINELLLLNYVNIENNLLNDKINNDEKNNFCDFEIIEEPISPKEEKINILMDEIIQNLTGNEEIPSTKIYELLENIKSEYLKYSLLFFAKFKKYYKLRVITCKNKNNFIHLSNIFNDLAIKKNNSLIVNEVIEVSQMIKYDDIFMTSMIQKKNGFLSTKTFWMNLIEENFVAKLNEYIVNILKINITDSKHPSKKKIDKKEEILPNLYNQVNGYKKLSKKQKSQLEEYSKEAMLLCVSKAISNMCNFLVLEKDILDIIDLYVEISKLSIESYLYLKNILRLKFKKQYLRVNDNHEQIKEKYGCLLSKSEIIILNAAKFLPKDNYINIFKVNKKINIQLKINLMKYQLNKFNTTIDERIQIWANFLNIKELKKEYNYLDIKNKLLNPKEELNEKLSKAFSIIDLDLDRTPLFREDNNHKKKASIILKSVNTLEKSIDYYQGMNFILLFLYQLLNYDEEETFYFLLAFEIRTKYRELFSNELANLVIFFKVFEIILEVILPEIHYSLLDKEIMTQFYATSWFVTLFTSEVEDFKKNKASKFIIMVLESFIFDGWAGIFNGGLAICYHNKDKILNYDGNELMRYMIADLNNINNISDEDFEKLHKLFLSTSEKINENF